MHARGSLQPRHQDRHKLQHAVYQHLLLSARGVSLSAQHHLFILDKGHKLMPFNLGYHYYSGISFALITSLSKYYILYAHMHIHIFKIQCTNVAVYAHVYCFLVGETKFHFCKYYPISMIITTDI